MGWRDFELSCHTETTDKPQSHFIDRNNNPKPSDNKAETKHPITEGRRKTLGIVADAILEQAAKEIQNDGIWQPTTSTRELENRINHHKLLLKGLTTLKEFRRLVVAWQRSGVTIY